MNPVEAEIIQQENLERRKDDLWVAVRLAAEGSDWKRDKGETLVAWAQRTLRTPRTEVGRTTNEDGMRLAHNLRHCAAEKMMRAGLEPDDPNRQTTVEWRAANLLEELCARSPLGRPEEEKK